MQQKQHSAEQELKELGIALDHKPTMPNSVPDGYFDNVKNDTLAQIMALDFVENLPKKMPQKVPAGYFEQSRKDIFSKIANSDTDNPLKLKKSANKRNWALAASIAALISCGLIFLDITPKTFTLENELSKIPAEQLQGYIEQNEYDFEAFEMLENPTITTKELEVIESKILEETKTLSNEELFVYVL